VEKVRARVGPHVRIVALLLVLVGLTALASFPLLARDTYVSENALMIGRVRVFASYASKSHVVVFGGIVVVAAVPYCCWCVCVKVYVVCV
jgi:hypothetical protein